MTPKYGSNGQSQRRTATWQLRAGRTLRFYFLRMARQLQTAVRRWEARTSLVTRRRQVLVLGAVVVLLWLAGLLSVFQADRSGQPGLLQTVAAHSRAIADTLATDSAYQQALRQRLSVPVPLADSVGSDSVRSSASSLHRFTK